LAIQRHPPLAYMHRALMSSGGGSLLGWALALRTVAAEASVWL
jgi:hypothetical protein